MEISPAASTRPLPAGVSLVRLLDELPLEDRPAVDAALAIGGGFLAAARALRSSGRDADAVALLAQALPHRTAVWWACRAVRTAPTAGVALPPGAATPLEEHELAALEAAEAWVRVPEQSKAEAAEAAFKRAKGTPAGFAALAAFLGGDNLAVQDPSLNLPAELRARLQPVPPPEHVCGIAALGAVRLAAVRRRPDLAARTLARTLDDGFALAMGTDGPAPSAASAAPPGRPAPSGQTDGTTPARRGH